MLRYSAVTQSVRRWAWQSSSRAQLSVAAASQTSLRVEVHPGSRLLYVDQSEGSNPLNTLAAIQHKLSQFQNNATLAAVVINISDMHLLSSVKTHGPPSSEGFKTAFKAASEFSNSLKTITKPTIAVFDGNISNATLSAFAGCTYRVATRNARFQLRGLQENLLPGGAQLLVHMTRSSPLGLAFTRYLAISEHAVGFEDLLGLGLVTHLGPDRMAESFAYALANSFPDNDNVKSVQLCSTMSGKGAIKGFLDALHPLDVELPPTDHELFQQVLLVPPDDVPLPADPDDEGTMPALKELEEVVKGVFESHDSQAVKARIKTALKNSTSPAVQRAMQVCMKNIDLIPHHVVAGLFAATRSAQNLPLSDFTNREARLIEEIFAGKNAEAAPAKK